MNLKKPSVFALSATLLFAGQASATTIYTYIGNSFTNATGLVRTSDFVPGSMTLNSALAADLVKSDITASVLPFSFIDGGQTFTESTGLATETMFVSTHATGAISAWNIDLRINVGDVPKRVDLKN